jgi:nucleoside 2-deoxyribosyltransferase
MGKSHQGAFEGRNTRIYLAGPEVFLSNALQIGELKKSICREYGFEGIYPLDSCLEVRHLPVYETGLEISKNNEDLIRSCSILIANITPFRGPSADAGTIYEMGFARGIGLKVYAYTNTAKSFVERTCSFLNIEYTDEGEIRDNNGMLIENYGMAENLMVEGCIHFSGGKLIVSDMPENELFTNLEGFEQCLKFAKGHIENLKK